MTREFQFATPDAESMEFCGEVVQSMLQLHGISQREAVGRINRRWKGVDFEEGDLRYHEPPEFWAEDIYYGHDSLWWNRPEGLKPLPFP